MQSNIEPFVFLPTYRVAVCKKCRFAYAAEEVAGHLLNNGCHRREYTAKEARDIAGRIKEIPNIFRTQTQLKDFHFPPPHISTIPFLHEPVQDGLKCRDCGFVSRQTQSIQKHCRVDHGWVNPRRLGGNASDYNNGQSDLPYISGIRCQRFFKNRQASRWFEVDGSRPDPKHFGESSAGQNDDVKSCIRRATAQGLRRVAQREERLIKEEDIKSEPNLWVRRVGCLPHLASIDRRLLLETVRPPKEDERLLRCICDSLRRVVRVAQATSRANVVGRAALFEVERKDVSIKPRKPFDSQLEEDTLEKYTRVLEQVLCYIFRTQEDWDVDDRPAYVLTTKQEDALDTLVRELEEMDATVRQDQEEAIDGLMLDLCVALFDHQLKESEYDNAMISALAVMMMRRDGGWQPATDATPRYSALIKLARMLVVRQSYLERQRQISTLKKIMSEQEAKEKADGMFDLVRVKVRRFMTLVGENGHPTPMDWLYDTRSYGLKIRYTTAEEGQLDWKGDTIMCQKVQFSMNHLSDMIHSLAGEAHAIMAMLLMLGKGDPFPAIPWDSLVDDASECRMGWSFVKDPRNLWPFDGRWWLLDRISQPNSDLAHDWIESVSADRVQFRVSAMNEYERMLDSFLELLLVLVHLCGGQPARAPELLGLRYRNTSQGGIRNVFIESGLVGFVAVYHKGIRITDQAKVIHRFVPQEIGELVIWLLWIVFPFWQRLRVMEEGVDEISPLLWADDIAWRSNAATGAAKLADAVLNQGRPRRWTPDRLRRALQKHSSRLMGQQINISMWRHIAIGISRKYCRGESSSIGEDGIDDEDNDDDGGLGDSAWDLQTGHGSHVAGMIYGRLLRQGHFGTATRRDRFRLISQQWHRFLGFGKDGASDSHPDRKRRRDVFEAAWEEAQVRRFKRACRVDIERQFRQMMGKTDVELRGIQGPTIQAIMRGEGPVVQVMGTGGGKSLSFMLPAYCSSAGVTIVIVPLVALRGDLHRRCQDAQIDSYVWGSTSSPQTATIIFVTPESAVTKGFRTFVNRLQGRHQLDRVAVDECHTVLDYTRDFRAKATELGRFLAEIETQLVFLTATLPPADEDEFFFKLGLSRSRVRLFRGPTTRVNIRYSVVRVTQKPPHEVSAGTRPSGTVDSTDELEQQVYQLVQKSLSQYEGGRVIVYCTRIAQAQQISELLQCPAYYHSVADNEGKSQILKKWVENGGAIVATNALGLGVDIPNIRTVIHAGRPRKLRDYAQESGRAGRDGMLSEAILVEMSDEDGDYQGDEHMAEFTRGRVCRRIILDRVMDGRTNRQGCEAGEEMCDICEGNGYHQVGYSEYMEQGDEIVDEDGTKVEGGVEVVRAFRSQRRLQNWMRKELIRKAQVEGIQTMEFEDELRQWATKCVVCDAARKDGLHRFKDCPYKAESFYDEVEYGVKQMRLEIFRIGGMEDYSGCFHCGLPQEMCERWLARDDDGGSFDRQANGRCQWDGVVVEVVVGLWFQHREEMEDMINGLMKEDGIDVEDIGARYKWFGRRVVWGGLETNRLCQVFYLLSRVHKEHRTKS